MRKRRRKRIRKRFFRRLILLFIAAFILYGLFGMIMEIGGIVKIKPGDISYIELIKFSNNDIKTIKESSDIKNITKELRRIRGSALTEEISNESDVIFINLYDRSLNKIEIINKGQFMSVDGIWYDVGKVGYDRFNRIINRYY